MVWWEAGGWEGEALILFVKVCVGGGDVILSVGVGEVGIARTGMV